MAILFNQLNDSSEWAPLLSEILRLENDLLAANPNYVPIVYNNLRSRMIDVLHEGQNLIHFSHDLNRYVIITVRTDGTIHYRYIF